VEVAEAESGEEAGEVGVWFLLGLGGLVVGGEGRVSVRRRWPRPCAWQRRCFSCPA
jgi:hypothetical protein